MAKLTESEYIALLRRELQEAKGYDADVLGSKRADASNYYFGIMPEPAEGRSDVVSHDVADVLHSIMAQTQEMFKSSLIEFCPNNEQDEPQAQLESDYVRYQVEMNDFWKVAYDAAFDSLLHDNGWIKVEVEENVEVEEDDLTGVDPIMIQQLMVNAGENETVEVFPGDNEGDFTIRRTIREYELKVCCIAPEAMIFSHDWSQYDFDELRFVGERKLYTLAELKEMGLSKEKRESIPSHTDDYWPGYRARQSEYQDDYDFDGNMDVQQAEILKECYDCYIRVDINQTGDSELRHVLWGGEHIIIEEPAEFIPYCTGSPIVIPHRTLGEGVFSLMGQIQFAKTTLLRQMIDNNELHLQGRYEVVENAVNMDDLLTGRSHGVVRVRTPGSVTPLQTPMTNDAALQMLNYYDQLREQRGGASLDLNDADRQVMQASATAAAGLMSNHEKMAGWYCSNLVNTLLKGMFCLVHKTLRYDMPGTVQAKLRGKWVETNPAQWQERKHVKVTAGLTSEQRTNKTAGLTQLMQYQAMALEQGFGGILTDPDKLFNALSDWIRSVDVGDPMEYLIDPTSEEAQQAVQGKDQEAQAQQQQAEQMQQMVLQMEQAKVELDKYKHDTELKFKYFDARLDANVKMETEEAKITVDAMKLQNDANRPKESTKAN